MWCVPMYFYMQIYLVNRIKWHPLAIFISEMINYLTAKIKPLKTHLF